MKIYFLNNNSLLRRIRPDLPNYSDMRSFLNDRIRRPYYTVLLQETEPLKACIPDLEQIKLPYEFPEGLRLAPVISLSYADARPARLLLPLKTLAVTWAYEAYFSRTSEEAKDWMPFVEKRINDYLESVGFLLGKASYQTSSMHDCMYISSGVSSSWLLSLSITRCHFYVYHYPLDFL